MSFGQTMKMDDADASFTRFFEYVSSVVKSLSDSRSWTDNEEGSQPVIPPPPPGIHNVG